MEKLPALISCKGITRLCVPVKGDTGQSINLPRLEASGEDGKTPTSTVPELCAIPLKESSVQRKTKKEYLIFIGYVISKVIAPLYDSWQLDVIVDII